MKLSIREAKARFSEAIAAVERGESVVVTKHGRAVAEIVQPNSSKSVNFEAGRAYLKSINFNSDDIDLWPDEFDDPEFSRKVLGLND